jgi:hypothetical protein
LTPPLTFTVAIFRDELDAWPDDVISLSIVGQLKLAGKQGISLEIGLDLYLEIRGGTSGKVDSFDGAGPFIEWDVGPIGENNVHAIGAISAVKPNELWAQRVCFENFPGHFTFFLVFRSGRPEPSKLAAGPSLQNSAALGNAIRGLCVNLKRISPTPCRAFLDFAAR